LELKEPELFDYLKEFYYSPWYINATPEGIWGFNLSTIPQPKWQDKWLPITTEFANRTSRTKLVGFLKLEDGILF